MNSNQVPQNEADYLSSLIAQANSAYANGSYDESAFRFFEALGILDSRGGDPATIAFVLQMLADSLFATNRFRDSLPFYQRLYQLGLTIVGGSHPQIVMVLSRISISLEMIGEQKEALEAYQAAIGVSERVHGLESEITLDLRNRTNLLRQKVDENAEAAQTWRKETGGFKSIPRPGSTSEPGEGSPSAPQSPPSSVVATSAPQFHPGNAPPVPQVQSPPPEQFSGPAMPPMPPAPPAPHEASATSPPGFPSAPAPAPPVPPPVEPPGAFQQSPPTQESVPPAIVEQSRSPFPMPPPPPPLQAGENAKQGVKQEFSLDSGVQGGPGLSPIGISPVGTEPAGDAQQRIEQPDEAPRMISARSQAPDIGLTPRTPDFTPSPRPASSHGPRSSEGPPISASRPVPPPPPPLEPPTSGSGDHLGINRVDSSGAQSNSGGYNDRPGTETVGSSVESSPAPKTEEKKAKKKRSTSRGSWGREPGVELRGVIDESKEANWKVNLVKSKEYVIPIIALIVLGVGGIIFYNTALKPAELEIDSGLLSGDGAAASAGVSSGPAEIYSTPDATLKVALRTDGSCTYTAADDALNLGFVRYDGSVQSFFSQCLSSLTERQIWFSEVPAGLQSDSGVLLYTHRNPDWQVVAKMRDVHKISRAFFQAQRSYPSEQDKLRVVPEFTYRNPFNDKREVIPLRSANEGGSITLQQRLESGSLVAGEAPYSPGEIRCYVLRKAVDGKYVGSGFYVRGADSSGNFFRSRKENKVLVLGEREGKDDSNVEQLYKERTAVAPEKSTRVWIAAKGQPPAFIIHHFVPIAFFFASFLGFLRSFMMRPGQTTPTSANKIFRDVGIISLVVAILSMLIQVAWWR